MNNEIYKNASGCIVTYKPLFEPLLFNELNARCSGIKLVDRSSSSAAFSIIDYSKIITEIHESGFVFLQHIHPYMCKNEISGGASDFAVFIKMLERILSLFKEDDIFTCQCRIATDKVMEYSNGDLTNLLATFIGDKGYKISPKDAEIAVSLTLFDNMAYMGLSSLKDNVSEWTGGVLFYSKTDDIMCRAEFKIEEAFKVFEIELKEGMKALDLGAAPGGWTHFLCKKDIFVDAVDPANLNQVVLDNKNVRHYKMTAQEFAKNNVDKKYDIIVNDMKMDTNESIDILRDMSKHLNKDGICILTLKLSKEQVQKRINTAKKVLSNKFEKVKIKQLYYNRSEVTVYMKNRLD